MVILALPELQFFFVYTHFLQNIDYNSPLLHSFITFHQNLSKLGKEKQQTTLPNKTN